MSTKIESKKKMRRAEIGQPMKGCDILVEALEAWLNARSPRSSEDALAARLARLDRHVEAVRRQQGLQWEVLARIMRHQILTAAGLPRADAALQAAAARQFEEVIDELARRVAGADPSPTSDPALLKLRNFQ